MSGSGSLEVADGPPEARWALLGVPHWPGDVSPRWASEAPRPAPGLPRRGDSRSGRTWDDVLSSKEARKFLLDWGLDRERFLRWVEWAVAEFDRLNPGLVDPRKRARGRKKRHGQEG